MRLCLSFQTCACFVLVSIISVCALRGVAADETELVEAFIFGARQLRCSTFNDAERRYSVVYHGTPRDLEYRESRGWGYETVYSLDPSDTNYSPYLSTPVGSRGEFARFGPIDASPNTRQSFSGADCWEEIYDSHIGTAYYLTGCSRDISDPPDANAPCHLGDEREPPEGIVFRVDVPNGRYRFVASAGDASQPHAHCIIAEDGGSGPPEQLGPNHVFLIRNFDQAQHPIGDVPNAGPATPALGKGVYARVGFEDKIPPPGDGEFPSPQFVDIGRDGLPSETGPDSPILQVTQGYVRIHQLQGNSNSGPGGFDRAAGDPNGGDLNVLELWRIRSQNFKRGDSNGDGGLDVSDAVAILGHLFLGNTPEIKCHQSADTDQSGGLNVTDAVYLLRFLFLGGLAPPPPFRDCGPEPGAGELSCASYPACE